MEELNVLNLLKNLKV